MNARAIKTPVAKTQSKTIQVDEMHKKTFFFFYKYERELIDFRFFDSAQK